MGIRFGLEKASASTAVLGLAGCLRLTATLSKNNAADEVACQQYAMCSRVIPAPWEAMPRRKRAQTTRPRLVRSRATN